MSSPLWSPSRWRTAGLPRRARPHLRHRHRPRRIRQPDKWPDASRLLAWRDLRAHELGHALGFDHVTDRTSLMNPNQIIDPTDFDRQAGSIAYHRVPGNSSPDSDPIGATINAQRQPLWSAPIH